MADSFADLWNSTAPSKPAQPTQPRTLGSVSATTQQPQRQPQNDVFSMLAASSSNSTRSSTPSYLASPQISKAGSTGGIPSVGSVKPVQKANSSGGDAFADLFSGTSGSNATSGNLTIAQRAALAEKQRLGQQSASSNHRLAPSAVPDSAWSGLDALGSSSFTGTRTTSVSPKPPQQDDWVFDSVKPAAPPISTSKVTVVQDDDWGLEDFVSKPAPAAAPSAGATGSLWDIDDFASSTAPAARASPAAYNGRASPSGSFDFGDREDGLLDDRSGDEDDILGVLGKPVQPKAPKSRATRARVTPSPRPPSDEAPSRGPPSRAVSPPPHILGQIVEMGFSVQQARVALAATESGLDVQAALETLLSNGAGAESRPVSSQGRRPNRRDDDRFPDAVERREEDSPPPRQRIPPRRDRLREPPSRADSHSPADSQKNIQNQANELLAQASTIGLSIFNRANALWKEGKEKAQKAYEERAVISASSSGSPSGVRPRPEGRDGRPKWMTDAPVDVQAEWQDDPAPAGGFVDDHDDDVLPPHPSEQPRTQRPLEQKPAVVQPTPKETPVSRAKTDDLLGGESPKVYVSPYRRKTPARTQAPPVSENKPSPARGAASAPAPLVQRKCVSASSSEMATSAKHKATGTEMYKLGRYAEAETAYSYAIAALPDSHLLLVPLYNNRALTRIKTGDHTGAVEDCTRVLKIIGASYHPAREAKVTKEEEGAGVDLADAYTKALRRRAEAYEGREKWESAKSDWETIIATDFAVKARSDALKAAGRCRRMLTTNDAGTTAASASRTAAPPKPKPKPQPKPKPVSLRATPPSEALNRVREANQAAEAEDQEKHALKDAVDAKLIAWKGGKETNLRALIASLDTVLWPELGLQKVGMHELVTPAQVKIRYTKAIAKLHPDKLNVNNTTVEQRMIANGVFGALNEAWNSFKP
ncbi:hypothetical protein BDW22DRAFT_1488020 [Trametopsis cervina]|nr:hypothetical protein BDW22DRAFT_1488020 [Trametopsis cervina]